MAVGLGENLITLFGVNSSGAAGSSARVAAPQAYKTAGYSSIPYSKAPAVKDSVPTKYSDGTPFWADYVTPDNVWVA